jgi:hypothetical protein
MTYFVETRWGGSERAPSVPRMREILDELDRSDPEHPDVWLTHESGWTLTAYESGLVVWQNPELDTQPRHLTGLAREVVLALWIQLSRGDLGALEAQPWQPGHDAPLDPQERSRREEEAKQCLRTLHRQFLEALGAERPDVPCRQPGCSRGAVAQSVLCRVHHFENVKRQPCPFAD